ncbi:MAG: hypothetical protein ABSF51_08005 [Verrucomicrobiota bacterium]|jgi:hypothetical protein
MKIKRTAFKDRMRWCGIAVLGLCGGLPTLRAADTNAPAATPPPLTPDQLFEGGTNIYNNWVEPAVGGFATSGNKAQAEQNNQSRNGAFGGIKDFHFGTGLGKNTTLSADGHALFDNRDYQLKLDLEQANIGFVRLNYDQFRTWENGDGGFYPPSGMWYPLSDDALALDNGTFSVEGGLRLANLPNVPNLTFKYTHTYRNGEEGSTIWGYSHPDPLNNPGAVRGLNPSYYNIDEHSDIFQLDATDHIKATDLGVGLRYETGNLNDSLNIVQWPGELIQQGVTDQSSVTYDLFNVHAFTETWLKDNLMFSTAYSYSDLHNDFTGSYVYQSNLGPSADGFGYNNLNGNSWVQDHVANLNLYARPMQNLSIVPSLRVQKEDSAVNASEIETFEGTTANPPDSQGDQSDLEVCERLDATYTGVTNWVYYVRGEWTEGSGNLNEYGGLIPIGGFNQFQSVQSQIDSSRFFQKYSAGLRWYPWYRVTVDAGGYYEAHNYNSNFPLDSTANNSLTTYRYPGYLVMQDFDTYDGNIRLTLRPWQNVSLAGRYEYQLSTINTEPDPISGLGSTESSRMTSHILAGDASWSPWSRLSLTAGINYVLSETKTPASDYTQAILNAQNNYWTVNFSSDFVVDDKTDLNVSYYYYRADDYNNYAAVGLPYGAGTEEHAVTAEIVRRLTENLRVSLKYGFCHYTDETSGGNNDFDSHLILATMQYRF